MGIFSRGYSIKVKCDNCGKDCEVNIKRGTTVVQALKNKELKCDNCGCDVKPMEYSTQWLK